MYDYVPAESKYISALELVRCRRHERVRCLSSRKSGSPIPDMLSLRKHWLGRKQNVLRSIARAFVVIVTSRSHFYIFKAWKRGLLLSDESPFKSPCVDRSHHSFDLCVVIFCLFGGKSERNGICRSLQFLVHYSALEHHLSFLRFHPVTAPTLLHQRFFIR